MASSEVGQDEEAPPSPKKLSPSKFLAAVRAGDEQTFTSELTEHGTALFDLADKNGRMSVHLAAREGHIRIIEIMTWNMYDLNTPNTTTGQTALHEAAAMGRVRMLHFLLAMGADPQRTDRDGLLPLHIATREGHNPCLSILAAVGCDISATTVSGYVPAHYAAVKGRLETLQLLHKLGSPLTSKAKDGNLPVEFAKANKHVECVEFLEQQTKSEDTGLPEIESREALEARVKVAQDKVVSLKEKSKALLQAKHEEWVTHLKTVKSQNGKKIEDLHKQLSEKLEEVKTVHATELESMQSVVSEQRLMLGEVESLRRDCRCGLSWPQIASQLGKTEVEEVRLPLLDGDGNKPSPSSKARTRVSSLSRQTRVGSAAAATPPAAGDKGHAQKSAAAAVETLVPPKLSRNARPGRSINFEEPAAPDSLPTLSQPPTIQLAGTSWSSSGAVTAGASVMDAPPSPGVLRSPRLTRTNSGARAECRVDTPAPGFSTPTLGRSSHLKVDGPGSQLRSPSLSDLHEASLRSAETMHGQRKLFQMDAMKPSPQSKRRSPLLDNTTASSSSSKHTSSRMTSPQQAAPNSGRSPGSLPHMPNQ